MHITIYNKKGEKRIDLSYSIHSDKEIAVIRMLSDNIQYKVLKLRSVMDPISDMKRLFQNKKGEKRIDLSYSIHSDKEIAVIRMLSDNIQYKVLKLRSVMDPISDMKRLFQVELMQEGSCSPL